MKKIEIKESVKIGDVILKEGTEIKVLPKLSEGLEDNLNKAIYEVFQTVKKEGASDVNYAVGNYLGWMLADMYGSMYGGGKVNSFIRGMISGLEED